MKRDLLSLLKCSSFLALSFLSLYAHAQTENYSWSNVAIGGGGFVTGIITSKSEQGLLYARTDVGGAYRWNSVNNQWTPLLDWVSVEEMGFMGVESIALDPHDGARVYMLVGTSYFNNGKTAILRSTDFGSTFTVMDVTGKFKAHGNGMGRQSGEKLQVDPNKNNVLYCGTRAHGLFRSSDYGTNWSRLESLPVTTTPNSNGISFVVLDASTGSEGEMTQTIVAGVSKTGVNLYQSNNGGETFNPIEGAPIDLMPHRAVLTSDRNLFITYVSAAGPWDISVKGEIWKYSLSNNTWTKVTPSGFTGAFGGISVDPINPNRLVASSLNTYQLQDNAYGDRIFLSTNGGNSWTDVVARGFDLDPNGISWIDGHAIHWAGSVEFDPFDTKKVWIVSGNGVFRTDDIDASTNVWSFQVNGLEETVPLDIVSVPNGPVVSVIGDYDGFIHRDVMQYSPTHSPRMGTTTGLAVASWNTKVMLRAGDKMFHSSDGGNSWNECTIKGKKGNVAVSADGLTFMHCPENSSATYRSTDKGETWEVVSGLTINNARPVADAKNPLKFYVYDPVTGKTFLSVDGGKTFTTGATIDSNGSRVMRSAPFVEGDVWVALNAKGLTRSNNGGTSFTKIGSVTACAAVGFGKELTAGAYPTIFIWGTVDGTEGIFRSTNEGNTWTRVNDDAHEFGGPGNGQFVVGDMNISGRVYMSTVGRGIVYGESSERCVPDYVTPYMKVEGDVLTQTSVIEVRAGESVTLSTPDLTGGTWQWSGPDDFSSSHESVTITDFDGEQAMYTLVYTNTSGCVSARQTFLLTPRETTVVGIENPESDEISFYPNPTSDSITIHSEKPLKTVIVFSVAGELVMQVDEPVKNMSLVLKDLSSGLYIIEVTDFQNHVFQKKIWKQ